MANGNKVEVSIGANTSELKTGMKESGEVVSKTVKEMENAGKSLKINIDTSIIEKSFTDMSRNVQGNMQKLSTNISDSFNKSFASISSSFKSVSTLLAGTLTVSNVIDMADSYGQMGAQIRKASTDMVEYNKVQDHLLETANTTYRSLEEAQQVYLDVGGALKAFGSTTEEALRITDSLSFSFTHNATASDKAASATNAFMKSIYSNKVSGDAFVTMLSAIPSIVDDLSTSMGESKDKILEMGNAGKITGNQLKKAFNDSREANEGFANDMENSVNDGLRVLKTELTVFIGKANEAHAVTGKIAAVLVALGKNISTVVAGVSAVAAVLATKYITQMALSIKTTVAATIENIRNQASLAGLSAQATLTTRSLAVLRGAMAVLGGPAGLGMLAVQGIAAGAAFLYLKKSSDQVEPSLESQGKSVAELKAEYDRLDAAQQRVLTRQTKADLTTAEEGFKKQEIALLGLVRAVINHSDATYEDKKKAKELYDQYLDGKIKADQLATGINNLKSVEEKHKSTIDEKSKSLTKEQEAVFKALDVLKSYSNVTRQSTIDNKAHTNSVNEKANAYANLTEKQRQYVDGVNKTAGRERYVQTNMAVTGISRERAEHRADAREAAGMGFTNKDGVMPKELLDAEQASWDLKQQEKARQEAEKKALDAKKKSEAANNKQTGNRLVGLVGSTGRSTGNHLHLQYPKGSGKGGVTAQDMALLQLGGQTLKPSMSKHPYGEDRGSRGKHGGWDFSAPAGTEITTNAAVKDVQKMVSETGGYTSRVFFENGVVLDLMHQIPAMMQKVKGGASKGSNTSSSKDSYQAFVDAEKNKLNLQHKYASQRKQVELDLEEELAAIRESTLSKSEKEDFAVKAKKEAADKIKAIELEELENTQDMSEQIIEGKELLAQRIYELEMAQTQALFEAKQISNSQRLQLEKQLEDKLYQTKRNALEDRLSLEMSKSAFSGKSDGVHNANESIAALDNEKTISDTLMPGLINDAQMKDFEDKFGGLTNRISGLWDKGIQAMMNGTLTWSNATNAVLTDMAGFFLQKMVTEPLRVYMTGLAQRMAIKLGFIKTETAAEVGGQAAQTTAVVAGEGVKTAATATGVLARLALKAGEAIKSIMMYAWEAMAGAFKAMVSIPYIGPFLAVGAGAAALALVGGLAGKIKSARGGYDIPAGVNPVTQLHEEEMVLPKQHANTIRALGRSMRNGGMEQPAMAGDGGGMSTINIQAWDSSDIRRFMRKHGRELAGGLKGYGRNFGK
ncbi:tape measure protein [Acinetobacter larvae]|uniref:Tape measure protein N-terminal domain-containing protein n=1 Tax=Acinetobacter larvae TaxID=1789224 RepID=A0A1B2LZA7_9GAMM|nr:tape measure protein [Acinetobacter larvae]AOA58280.1 hypothetical protein BFG52_07860 [Acinetobacter larvae]